MHDTISIPTIQPTGIYTAADLSRMLDVSPDTQAEARRNGALRYVRKGRRTIYLGEWVLTWLRGGEGVPHGS